MKLYEIAAEYREILEGIEDAGGELTPEQETALNLVNEALPEKVDAIACLVREREASAAAFEIEITRLTAHRNAERNAAENLKSYLRRNLEAMGFTNVDGKRFKVRIQKNSQVSIKWTREIEDLPESFRRIKVEPDLERARQAVKAYEVLPVGFEVNHGSHLRIS